jgi:hypothetical protein
MNVLEGKTREQLQEELHEVEGLICDLARIDIKDESMLRARKEADRIQAAIDRIDDEIAALTRTK